MPDDAYGPPVEAFAAAAEQVAQARPEVDLELAREAGDLHDPASVSAAYLVAAAVLQL